MVRKTEAGVTACMNYEASYNILEGSNRRAEWVELFVTAQLLQEHFITCLVLHNGLFTAVKIGAGDISCDVICSSCNAEDIITPHLLCKCSYRVAFLVECFAPVAKLC